MTSAMQNPWKSTRNHESTLAAKLIDTSPLCGTCLPTAYPSIGPSTSQDSARALDVTS
jgi:hypothetical protein